MWEDVQLCFPLLQKCGQLPLKTSGETSYFGILKHPIPSNVHIFLRQIASDPVPQPIAQDQGFGWTSSLNKRILL